MNTNRKLFKSCSLSLSAAKAWMEKVAAAMSARNLPTNSICKSSPNNDEILSRISMPYIQAGMMVKVKLKHIFMRVHKLAKRLIR